MTFTMPQGIMKTLNNPIINSVNFIKNELISSMKIADENSKTYNGNSVVIFLK